MNKRVKNLLMCGILSLGISLPTQIESIGTVSVARPVVVARPVSIAKPSTVKVTTMKPVTTKTIPRVNTSKASTKSNTTSIKADSGNFSTKSNIKYSVKPKVVKPSTNKTNTKHYKTYYSHYPTNVYYNNNMGFWNYYMLSEMFDNDEEVTERDIARELENRGYSENEVNQILDDARDNEKESKLENVFNGFMKFALIVLLIFLLICFFI